MEEVYNFADTGYIEGLDYSHWVEIEDCVLTNGNLTVDHREINMNAFQIYPEFIDTAWYVVSTDMNYIRLVLCTYSERRAARSLETGVS